MDNPTSTTNGWDIVDEASFESFPASDPPGYGSAHAATATDEAFLPRESPARAHALVVFDSVEDPQIEHIAHSVRSHLARAGFIAELADASTHAASPPPGYEIVVVGMSVRRFARRLLRRRRERRTNAVPAAVFVVESRASWLRALARVFRMFDWNPILIVGPDDNAARIADFADRVADLVQPSMP